MGRLLSILNVLLVAGLMGLVAMLYVREHATRQAERDIRKLTAQIAREEETLRLLDVEWAMLTNPARLQRLAGKYLKLAPPDARALQPADAALSAIAARPARPQADGADALARLIGRIAGEGERR
ncbi:MAG TPA: cell division protein FtsL [Thermopetrobacter sp.]|nr:cell division protein FtsL [Thermopetrobacter sp.]